MNESKQKQQTNIKQETNIIKQEPNITQETNIKQEINSEETNVKSKKSRRRKKLPAHIYKSNPDRFNGHLLQRYILLGFRPEEARQKIENLKRQPTPPPELIAISAGHRSGTLRSSLERTAEETKLLKKYCRQNGISGGYRKWFLQKLNSGLSLEDAMQKTIMHREVSASYRPISHDKINLKIFCQRNNIGGKDKRWFNDCIREGYQPQQILLKMRERKAGIDPCLAQRQLDENGEYRNLTWRRRTNRQPSDVDTTPQQMSTSTSISSAASRDGNKHSHCASYPNIRTLSVAPGNIKNQHLNSQATSSTTSSTSSTAPKFNYQVSNLTSSIESRGYKNHPSSSTSSAAPRKFNNPPTSSTSSAAPRKFNNPPTSSASSVAPKKFNNQANSSTSAAARKFNNRASNFTSSVESRRYTNDPSISSSSVAPRIFSNPSHSSTSSAATRKFNNWASNSTSSVEFGRRTNYPPSSTSSVAPRNFNNQPINNLTSPLAPKRNGMMDSRSTGVRMAILPTQYTHRTLNTAELRLLEDAVIEEVGRGWEVNLQFKGINFGRGMLLVDCENFETAEWLIYVAPRLSGWSGRVELMACLEDNIPMPHQMG